MNLLNETETSTAVSSYTPENIIGEVHMTDGTQNSAEKILKERLELAKLRAQKLEEAIDNQNLTQELLHEKSDLYKVRYQLQKFTNGGTPYIDEGGVIKTDNKPGEPSQYEAWRYDINEKKRKARVQQEKNDRNSIFASPKITKVDYNVMLDGQEDEFLTAWAQNQKSAEETNKKLNESMVSLNSILSPYKKKKKELEVIREAKRGNWIPEVKLSKFYESVMHLTTDEEWPILREAILDMQDLERKIFSNKFKLQEAGVRNRLLEQYARVGSLSNMQQLRERGVPVSKTEEIDRKKHKADLDAARRAKLKAIGGNTRTSLASQGIQSYKDKNGETQYRRISDITKPDSIVNSEGSDIEDIAAAKAQEIAKSNLPAKEKLKKIQNLSVQVKEEAPIEEKKGILSFLKRIGGAIAKSAGKIATAVGYGLSAFKFGGIFAPLGPVGITVGALIGLLAAYVTKKVGKAAANMGAAHLYPIVLKGIKSLAGKRGPLGPVAAAIAESPKCQKWLRLLCTILPAVLTGAVFAGSLVSVAKSLVGMLQSVQGVAVAAEAAAAAIPSDPEVQSAAEIINSGTADNMIDTPFGQMDLNNTSPQYQEAIKILTNGGPGTQMPNGYTLTEGDINWAKTFIDDPNGGLANLMRTHDIEAAKAIIEQSGASPDLVDEIANVAADVPEADIPKAVAEIIEKTAGVGGPEIFDSIPDGVNVNELASLGGAGGPYIKIPEDVIHDIAAADATLSPTNASNIRTASQALKWMQMHPESPYSSQEILSTVAEHNSGIGSQAALPFGGQTSVISNPDGSTSTLRSFNIDQNTSAAMRQDPEFLAIKNAQPNPLEPRAYSNAVKEYFNFQQQLGAKPDSVNIGGDLYKKLVDSQTGINPSFNNQPIYQHGQFFRTLDGQPVPNSAIPKFMHDEIAANLGQVTA
jgi:hypothetical protein